MGTTTQTEAILADGGWSVNGRKLWTSNAHCSHYMIALLRTSPPEKDNRRHGLTQFLVESLILGLLGGIVGAGVGFAAAEVLGRMTGWSTVVSPEAVLLALVFSFLCSVAEAVLLSVTPSYVAGLRKDRPKKAALLKRLKQVITKS